MQLLTFTAWDQASSKAISETPGETTGSASQSSDLVTESRRDATEWIAATATAA